MSKRFLVTLALLLLSQATLFASFYSVPDGFPTKLENGINISTKPVFVEILPNRTANQYYYANPPIGLGTIALSKNNVQVKAAAMGINALWVEPISSMQNYTVLQEAYTLSNITENQTLAFYNLTVRMINFTTEAKAQSITGGIEYLLVLNVPAWKAGSWNYSQGAFKFDPDAFCGGTINTPGIYTMTENCYQNATAITIATDNVSLDCAGFWIVGNNSTTSYGITYNSRNNINITNCNIANYTDAIRITGTGTGGVISNNNLTGLIYGLDIPAGSIPKNLQIHHNNMTLGSVALISAGRNHSIYSNYLQAANQYGTVLAYDLNGSTLDNNTIISTGTGNKGVYFYPYTTDVSDGWNTISNSYISSTDNGVDFDNYCQYCNVANTTIVGTNASGKYGVRTDQDYTTVRNATITNYSTGIIVRDNGNAKGLLVDNCSVSSTGGVGVYPNTGGNHSVKNSKIDGCVAVSVDTSWTNITNNTLNGTCGNAITVQASGGNTLILNNTAIGNANYAGQATGAGNVWAGNRFTSASTYTAFRALGGTIDSFYNNTFNNTAGGSGFRDDSGAVYLLNNTFQSASGFALTSATASATYVNSTILGIAYISGNSNILNGSSMTSYLQIAGGTGTQVNGLNINSTSHGIYITGGSNHAIDCMGGTLRGNNGSAVYGFYSDQNNITAKNCIITNFTDAIRINGGDNSLIQNMSASTTKTGSYSANFLVGSENNTLRNSTMSSLGTAIALAASAINNTILNNNMTSAIWVNNANATNNFNDSTSGNIYYASNGSGAWTFGNGTTWQDTNANGYADTGTLPLNATTFSGYWVGLGGDWHPYTTNLLAAPNFTFISQYPADVNSTNALNTSVSVVYNITGTLVNSSTAQLWTKVNGTGEGDSCWRTVNGTTTCGYISDGTPSISTNTYNFSFDHDFVLPSNFPLPLSLFDSTTSTQNNLTSNTQFVKFTLYNVSNTTQYDFVMGMVNSSATATLSLRAYYCNSSYTTGNILSSPYCTLVDDLPAGTPYESVEGNSSYHIMPLPMVNGAVNGIKVTPTSHFLIRGRTTPGNTWHWYSIPNITRPDNTQTTSDTGATWANFSGTFNAHLHQFGANDTWCYYPSVNTTEPKAYNGTERCDLLQLAGLPPSSPNVYQPQNATYNQKAANITINWTACISPNGYPISAYRIELYYSNDTYNSSIANVSNTTLGYLWDASNVSDAQYNIHITCNDSLNQSSFGESEVFTFLSSTSINCSITYPLGTGKICDMWQQINVTCIDNGIDGGGRNITARQYWQNGTLRNSSTKNYTSGVPVMFNFTLSLADAGGVYNSYNATGYFAGVSSNTNTTQQTVLGIGQAFCSATTGGIIVTRPARTSYFLPLAILSGIGLVYLGLKIFHTERNKSKETNETRG